MKPPAGVNTTPAGDGNCKFTTTRMFRPAQSTVWQPPVGLPCSGTAWVARGVGYPGMGMGGCRGQGVGMGHGVWVPGCPKYRQFPTNPATVGVAEVHFDHGHGRGQSVPGNLSTESKAFPQTYTTEMSAPYRRRVNPHAQKAWGFWLFYRYACPILARKAMGILVIYPLRFLTKMAVF